MGEIVPLEGPFVEIDTATGAFTITDVLLQAWTTRFPAADLRREHPLMVLWLLKNPAKRPKNPVRFIENWLRKVQEREVRNLAETSKRGADSAARIGARYNVQARPGESQEEYNRRVIRCAAGSVLKVVGS